MRHVRRLCLAVLALATLACGSPPSATTRKLIVLAVDGLDPEITERLIHAGRVPHLAEFLADLEPAIRDDLVAQATRAVAPIVASWQPSMLVLQAWR